VYNQEHIEVSSSLNGIVPINYYGGIGYREPGGFTTLALLQFDRKPALPTGWESMRDPGS